MSASSPRPILTVYRRAHCSICDVIAVELQQALEERAARGDVVPQVDAIDVDSDPALAERYGALIPVLVAGGQELSLVMSGRQVRTFLERTMPRTA